MFSLPSGDVELRAVQRERQCQIAVSRAYVDDHSIHVRVQTVRPDQHSVSVDSSTADFRRLHDAQVFKRLRRVVEIAERAGLLTHSGTHSGVCLSPQTEYSGKRLCRGH